MTIEEKMEHFKDVSLENASAQSDSVLTAYKQSLDEQFEKHKETATIDSQAIENSKLSSIKLDAKRELSKAQAEVRRTVMTYQNKLKSQVFSEVIEKLNEYKKTDAYLQNLISQIKGIMNDFDEDSVEFYIDSSDEQLLSVIVKETGANVKLSTISFIGGCKAIITSRNMLVDNSFKTKLADEQEQFSISI